MTKEDWAKVEAALSGVYGRAVLMVDGRKITFNRSLIKKNQLGIVTYIEDELKGSWFLEGDCPEKAYLCPYSKYVWSAKSRENCRKLGKKTLKRMDIDPDEKRHGVKPFWTNTQQIRRHYQKTFKSIELVEVLG